MLLSADADRRAGRRRRGADSPVDERAGRRRGRPDRPRSISRTRRRIAADVPASGLRPRARRRGHRAAARRAAGVSVALRIPDGARRRVCVGVRACRRNRPVSVRARRIELPRAHHRRDRRWARSRRSRADGDRARAAEDAARFRDDRTVLGRARDRHRGGDQAGAAACSISATACRRRSAASTTA